MKALEEMLAEKRAQLTRLEVEIATLEAALRRATGEPEVVASPRRSRRANVKQLVIELLQEQGAAGLNAQIAVELAGRRGERLERGTVSSLLSRMKAEGLVTYDNVVYRLAPKTAGQTVTGGNESTDRFH
jgi:hypothetical protein